MAKKKVSLHPIEDAISDTVNTLRELEPLVDTAGKGKIAKAMRLLRGAKSNIIILCGRAPINPPHSIWFTLAPKKGKKPPRRRSRE